MCYVYSNDCMLSVYLHEVHVGTLPKICSSATALAARITAPSLKKLSLTFTDWLKDVTLPNLSELICGATDLSKKCKFARVKFKHKTSIVMDQNELRAGYGAFKLMFSLRPWESSFEKQLKIAIHVCGELPSVSDVTSLLLKYPLVDRWPRTSQTSDIDCKMWHRLLGLFKNVDTLRVVNRLVDKLNNALQPDAGNRVSIRTALPKLKKVVFYGPYGSRVVQSIAN